MHPYILWRVQKLAPASTSLFLSLVFAPANILVPSDSRRGDLAKLAVLGTIVTGFFLFTGATLLPDGAAQFFDYANAIVHRTTLPESVAMRDAGYPLLIILSGYPFLHSLIPLMLLQAAFAIILPLLIYEALWRLSRTVGFYTALASIVTLGPYYLMKMLHHDQTYVFFSMLMLCLALIFVQTKQIHFLYFFTLAAIAASIARPAGNALFPLFFIVGYLAVRGKIRHYLVCCAIFALFVAGYAWHRYVIFDVQRGGVMPSYTGEQVFYAPYVNAFDYGIRLDPDYVGPNFKAAFETLRNKLADPGFQHEIRVRYSEGQARRFGDSNIFPFTPDGLINRVLVNPNFEYFILLSLAVDDRVLLLAAGEIARAYPGLILRYLARNLYHFILNPGYTHPRYSVDPLRPQELWFYQARGYVHASDAARLSEQAASEARFNPLTAQPAIIRKLFDAVQRAWARFYQDQVLVVAVLMCVAWMTAITALAYFVSRQRYGSLAAVNSYPAKLLTFADGFMASIIITSLSFGYNAVVTALFADPDFRYRIEVDSQAAVLAGLGAIAALRLVTFAFDRPRAGLQLGVSGVRPSIEWLRLAGVGFETLLIAVALGHFVAKWVSAGDLIVRSATYGANCGAQAGNVAQNVKDDCDGTKACHYVVDVNALGDPADGCEKDFSVQYACGANSPTRIGRLPGEAHAKTLNITCQPGHFVAKRVSAGDLIVRSATYGANCGAQAGNVTQNVKDACDGTEACHYVVDVNSLGDPADGCEKDFSVEYVCTGSAGLNVGPVKTEVVTAEAIGNAVNLACGGQK